MDEARALSRVLGGTDKDVKAYFFALPKAKLKLVLDRYEAAFGADKRQYAEEAFPYWATGRRGMSGLVADRLFQLLPPMMPLADKYRLTESLWNHYGPSSRKVLRIGPDVTADQVAAAFLAHVEGLLVDYRIPEPLEARFAWLSAGDVTVKQQLLNYLVQREREVVAEGVRLQTPVMLEHLAVDAAGQTTRIAHVVKVGKHELEILADRNATGLSLEEPSPKFGRSSGSENNIGCLIALVVVGVILWLIFSGAG
ncbi:hypothetical protein [Brevundimonas sp.]|jgi:hypothetical protein|uniref:hypothetical protein n=1 Tax=Brevundimonas sp. TaxID=1871086 RepID=UPI002E128378